MTEQPRRYGYMKEGIDFNPDSFFVRSSRGYSADGRGDAAVATWIVREGESRRRRGRDVYSLSRRRPAAATATWIVRGGRRARQVPETAIVNEDGMSAAITLRFAEKNGSTTLFAAQFVALDKPTEDNDLYTMVRLRSGSLDAAAQRNVQLHPGPARVHGRRTDGSVAAADARRRPLVLRSLRPPLSYV